jgi:type VI secretion system protein ImpC
MPGRMELSLGDPGSRRPQGDDDGLRLLFLGDWSGRGGIDPAAPLARRPLVRVEAERFDDALARVAPRLALTVADTSSPFEPRRLEDFHPDELYRSLVGLAGLREVRRRLLDPATFAATAAALEGSPAPVEEDDASTLARLLGAPRSPPPPAQATVSRLIADIVGPHVAPDIGARQRPLVAAVEAATGEHLRGILRDPAFRRLEAGWRAVHRLSASLESGDVAVYLLDVARPELGGLGRRLAEPAPDGRPWSLFVLDESFGPGADDVDLLSALGTLAGEAGAPLVAGGTAALLGCRSLAATPDPADWSPPVAEEAARWQALRRSPAAAWLGLVLPRWLQRLPYGAQSDPLESLPFEELAGGRPHEAYLWGNAAFACAQVVAGGDADIGDLPAHTYRLDGEAHLQACAEAYLGERALRAIAERGLMPLASSRDRNAVRLTHLQSLADPPAPLAGLGS